MKTDLRAFSSGNESFRAAQNPPTFGATVAALTGSTPQYLDTSWNVNPKHGYNLTYAGAVATFGMIAVPQTANVTAVNTYCVDQTGVVVGSVVGAGAPTSASTGCSGGTVIA